MLLLLAYINYINKNAVYGADPVTSNFIGRGGGCPEIEKKSVDGKYVSYITDEGFRCIDLYLISSFCFCVSLLN